jgi:hypothetical protein
MNNCGTGAHVPYFMNFLSDSKVRTCSTICSTDAGATAGYYNNCITAAGTSGRVLTVWRK